jgi:hypothetical protein
VIELEQLRLRKRLLLPGIALTSATVAGGVLAIRGSANQPPPPGISAGVSALERLPAASNLPPRVVRFVEFAAAARATDPEQAKARVRRLRSHLGRTDADLYAFRTSGGATCFVLVGEVGACPKSANDGSPGLQWTIGGGHDEVPSNLVGIASDDVARVDLVVDGKDIPTSLRNNVVFAEYPSSARQAVITIHRSDDSQTAVQVRLEPTTSNRDLRLLRTGANR